MSGFPGQPQGFTGAFPPQGPMNLASTRPPSGPLTGPPQVPGQQFGAPMQQPQGGPAMGLGNTSAAEKLNKDITALIASSVLPVISQYLATNKQVQVSVEELAYALGVSAPVAGSGSGSFGAPAPKTASVSGTDEPIPGKCQWQMKSGVNKGRYCSKKITKPGYDYCTSHIKSVEKKQGNANPMGGFPMGGPPRGGTFPGMMSGGVYGAPPTAGLPPPHARPGSMTGMPSLPTMTPAAMPAPPRGAMFQSAGMPLGAPNPPAQEDTHQVEVENIPGEQDFYKHRATGFVVALPPQGGAPILVGKFDDAGNKISWENMTEDEKNLARQHHIVVDGDNVTEAPSQPQPSMSAAPPQMPQGIPQGVRPPSTGAVPIAGRVPSITGPPAFSQAPPAGPPAFSQAPPAGPPAFSQAPPAGPPAFSQAQPASTPAGPPAFTQAPAAASTPAGPPAFSQAPVTSEVPSIPTLSEVTSTPPSIPTLGETTTTPSAAEETQ